MTPRSPHRLGLTALGLALAVTAAGCPGPGSYAGQSQAAGSIAIDDATGKLFVADADNDGLAIIDPSKSGLDRVRLVATGVRPERVVKSDEGIFVSNRMSRSVTQVDPATAQVVRTFQVGAEPVGLRVVDGTLYVAHATAQSVVALDVATGDRKWETNVGEDVRGLGILPDGRAYVPGFKTGTVHVLDIATGRQTGTFSLAQPVDLRAGVDFDRAPLFAQDVVVAPGGRTYFAHSQTTNIDLPPITAGYYAAGPAPAIAPGVTTVTPANNTVLAERQPELFQTPDPAETPFPSTMLRPTVPIAGPEVAVTDSRGDFLFVVNKLSNNVTILSTTRQQYADDFGFGLGAQGVQSVIGVGKGPTGIAISADNRYAYVWNSFEHSISVLGTDQLGNLSVKQTLTGLDGAALTPHTLSADARRGRELFHDATSSSMTNVAAGGVACASCHPGGRDDGHTWKFAEGNRNTPLLAGKHLGQTKPFHWDGQLAEMSDFQHVVERRMGGTGISRDDFEAMLTWLDEEPTPDNPHRTVTGDLSELALAGKELFDGKAGCATCHAGANLTDNGFWNVGTALQMIPIERDGAGVSLTPADRLPATPNTPTLIGLWTTGPWLHDGSITTLRDRVEKNPGDVHGKTAALSPTEKDALVAYLESL